MNRPEWLFDSRWTRLGLQAIAVVVLLALFAVGAWAWYRSQESRGLTALGEVTPLVQQAEEPQATPEVRAKAIAALESILSQYPRLSSVPQVAYELGNLKYASDQYAPARGAYQLALAKGASGAVAALAGMGIGYTWEAEKNYANAATAYEAVARQQNPKEFLYEDALVAEARAQDLGGKPVVALELYERVLREVPGTRHADDLRNRIASLRARIR
jgi:tetratricopeptide (TPR) repeat protein